MGVNRSNILGSPFRATAIHQQLCGLQAEARRTTHGHRRPAAPPPGGAGAGADTAPQIGGRGDLPTAVRDVHVHLRSAKPNATGSLPRCGGAQLRAMEARTNMDRVRP
jgi:hypothetical protein